VIFPNSEEGNASELNFTQRVAANESHGNDESGTWFTPSREYRDRDKYREGKTGQGKKKKKKPLSVKGKNRAYTSPRPWDKVGELGGWQSGGRGGHVRGQRIDFIRYEKVISVGGPLRVKEKKVGNKKKKGVGDLPA